VSSDARIHYSYLDVGGRAPNVVQSSASVYYFIRSPKIEDSTYIYNRINNIAEGAALMMGTEVEVDLKVAIADYLPNLTLSQLLYESIQEFGLPEFTEKEFDLAKEYYNSLDESSRRSGEDKMIKNFGTKEGQEMIKQGLSTKLNKFTGNYGELQVISSDVGDLSHYTPAAQIFLATSSIGTPLHTWQMTAQANSSIGKKGLFSAMRSLALAAITTIQNAEIIKKSQEELENIVGKYESPLPNDLKIMNPKVEK